MGAGLEPLAARQMVFRADRGKPGCRLERHGPTRKGEDGKASRADAQRPLSGTPDAHAPGKYLETAGHLRRRRIWNQRFGNEELNRALATERPVKAWVEGNPMGVRACVRDGFGCHAAGGTLGWNNASRSRERVASVTPDQRRGGRDPGDRETAIRVENFEGAERL